MTSVNDRVALAAQLRAEREHRAWDKREMAARLREALPDRQRPDLDTLISYVKRWESGKVGISERYRFAYATAFNHDNQQVQPVSATSADTVEGTPTPDEDEDEVKRRQLMRDAAAVAMSATVAPVLTTLTDAWQKSEPRIAGASVSQSMIDDWAAGYDVHIRSYAVDPPETVLPGLTRDWAEMAPHLAQDQPETIQRDLVHAAARHAYLIAAICVQLGDRRFASRWWRTAHSLADRSGDRLLSSFTRSWEVTNRVLEAREDLTDLLALAQDARRHAGRRPSVEQIYATTVEAEVLAFMGRHDSAVASMRHAEQTFDKIPASEPRREELLRFDQTCVYSLAGLQKEASEAEDAALRFYRPDAHLYTATQIRLYAAILHSRTDPTEASRQAVRIIDPIPADRRDKRVVLAARRVFDALPEPARTFPAARELRELTSL
jgi:transcriptional regulator with XRE-family HTH domain